MKNSFWFACLVVVTSTLLFLSSIAVGTGYSKPLKDPTSYLSSANNYISIHVLSQQDKKYMDLEDVKQQEETEDDNLLVSSLKGLTVYALLPLNFNHSNQILHPFIPLLIPPP
jgi:hypothetical protein